MNKLKVVIQDLRDYLGSDAQGKDFLNKVTKVANEQRTRCASLETTNAELVTNDKKLRAELDAAKTRIEGLQKENEREVDKRKSAEVRAQALQAQLTAIQDPEEPPPVLAGADRYQKVNQLFKRVLRRYKRMPGTVGDEQTIVVDDFIRSYSNDEFMGFGMVAALLGFLGLAPAIVTEESLDVEGKQKFADQDKFLDWFKNRVFPNHIVRCLAEGTNPRTTSLDRDVMACEELPHRRVERER